MTLEATSVMLRRFPRDDAEFDAVLEGISAEVGGLLRVGPDSFQERLRRTYPRAVVHEQDPLGGLSLDTPAWYVYRDGSPLAR